MAGRTARHPDLQPSHPGELLREIVIPATGLTKTAIAGLLGVSRQTLYDILAEKQGVTPPMAVRLGAMFGDGADVWMRMQIAHDLWQAERDLKNEVAMIPRLTAAA
jgi:antitoxin HigA-1